MTSPQQFWDEYYGQRDDAPRKPNELLVREADSLTPGTVLDLGCAEGGDAIWFAERGWRVTAVDVSRTALDRATSHARDAGVASKIDWQRHDLARSFPTGSYDLVSAQFLHSPVEGGDRVGILRQAAAAVAPGGVLLIVGHEGWPTWHENPPVVHFSTTSEVLIDLDLDDDRWEVERSESVLRDLPGPEGQPGTRVDNVLRVRRKR
jgi:SAM-dependent methyltransferase